MASVTISPNPVHVLPGQSVNVTATARNAAGEALSNRSATWTVEGDAAQVIETGAMTAEVTAVATGTATLRASVQGVEGTATINVDATVSVSGPAYAEAEYITLTATPNPAGSYYYEWSYTYCKNEPNVADSCPNYSGSGTSGQDVSTYDFYMSPYYYYASFQVEIRESAGGPVLASDGWTVDGAGQEGPENCVGGICPESVEPNTTATVQ